MQEIINLNTLGMCAEEFCSRPAAFYQMVDINGLRVMVTLCYKHAQIWEEQHG